MDPGRGVELLEHGLEVGVAASRPPIDRTRSSRISARRSASIVRPTIFARSISNSAAGGSTPLHDRDVRRLVAEVAEVDRERRLRGPRDADEDDVRLVEPAADPVVVLDGELDRLDPLEVRLVERRPGARLHPRRHTGHARDRVDRVPEQVAVVDAGAAAEPAHLVAEAGLDERVDHHRRPSPRAGDGEREVIHRLDAWMAHLLEREIGELRLEREHEARRGLSRRVRDDVELDGGAHGAEPSRA